MMNTQIPSGTVQLNLNTPSIQHICKVDKRIAKVISMVGDLEYVPHSDGYAFLIHEIIEQMLSIKAGKKIYQRLSALCDDIITPTKIVGLSDEQIKSCGTSKSKAEYIKVITQAIVSKDLILPDLTQLSDLEVIKELTKYKGIGNWTAKMYLIFVLDRKDVLPYEDVAFLQVYKWLYKTEDISPKAIQKKCQKWKPYSSIAARYMYRALDLGFTKNEFRLFK